MSFGEKKMKRDNHPLRSFWCFTVTFQENQKILLVPLILIVGCFAILVIISTLILLPLMF